ncbi:hypothetical protein QE152_g21886 [Popillia japonica]|uniref:Uncharacterized protein n=1 Tax=Popillia japonica TaxID=7064 RepID=A0AAW1KMM6_POPJA
MVGGILPDWSSRVGGAPTRPSDIELLPPGMVGGILPDWSSRVGGAPTRPSDIKIIVCGKQINPHNVGWRKGLGWEDTCYRVMG